MANYRKAAGSSRIVKAGSRDDYGVGDVVAYHNDAKQKLLGVASRTLAEHGAVSEATVREIHHTGKIDAPSGTAITLGNILLKNMKKEKLAYERRVKKEETEIDVLGQRIGQVAGQHEIWFNDIRLG